MLYGAVLIFIGAFGGGLLLILVTTLFIPKVSERVKQIVPIWNKKVFRRVFFSICALIAIGISTSQIDSFLNGMDTSTTTVEQLPSYFIHNEEVYNSISNSKKIIMDVVLKEEPQTNGFKRSLLSSLI